MSSNEDIGAIFEEMAEATSGGPTTNAVRVPGRPSFERLMTWIVWGVQSGLASEKTMPGNGQP